MSSDDVSPQQLLAMKKAELEQVFQELELVEALVEETEGYKWESEAESTRAATYAALRQTRATLADTEKLLEETEDEVKAMQTALRAKDDALVAQAKQLQQANQLLLESEVGLLGLEDEIAAERNRTEEVRDELRAAKLAHSKLHKAHMQLLESIEDSNEKELVTELENKVRDAEKAAEASAREKRALEVELEKARRTMERLVDVDSKLVSQEASQAAWEQERKMLNGRIAKLDELVDELRTAAYEANNQSSSGSGSGSDADSQMSILNGIRNSSLTPDQRYLNKLKEKLRTKDKLIKALEERLEMNQSTQVVSVNNTLTNIQDHRFLLAENKRLKEDKLKLEGSLKAQHTHINQLKGRLDFLAKAMRTPYRKSIQRKGSAAYEEAGSADNHAELLESFLNGEQEGDDDQKSTSSLSSSSSRTYSGETVPVELFDFLKKQIYLLRAELKEKNQGLSDLQLVVEQRHREVQVMTGSKASQSRKAKAREADLLKKIDDLNTTVRMLQNPNKKPSGKTRASAASTSSSSSRGSPRRSSPASSSSARSTPGSGKRTTGPLPRR